MNLVSSWVLQNNNSTGQAQNLATGQDSLSKSRMGGGTRQLLFLFKIQDGILSAWERRKEEEKRQKFWKIFFFWQFFSFFHFLFWQSCSDFVLGCTGTEEFVLGFLILPLSRDNRDKGTGTKDTRTRKLFCPSGRKCQSCTLVWIQTKAQVLNRLKCEC